MCWRRWRRPFLPVNAEVCVSNLSEFPEKFRSLNSTGEPIECRSLELRPAPPKSGGTATTRGTPLPSSTLRAGGMTARGQVR